MAKKAIIWLVLTILSAIGGIVCLIVKIAMNAEVETVEDSSALFVQVGNQTMSKSEFYDYADELIAKVNTGMIVCFIAAAAFLVLCIAVNANAKKKAAAQNTDNQQ